MNIELLTREMKEDIEDQSLEVLAGIASEVVVIGGWAVRALGGTLHGRYTLDVDAVAGTDALERVHGRLLGAFHLERREHPWGVSYGMTYVPRVPVKETDRPRLEGLELRIEVSGPRIHDIDGEHFFEFPLEDAVPRKLHSHVGNLTVPVKVPSSARMAAAKLGLPPDYKNSFDAVVLLTLADVDEVVRVILATDGWRDLVVRRLRKQAGHLRARDRFEWRLAEGLGLDLDAHTAKLERIRRMLEDG
jgi:hypothetical protein